MRERLYVIRDDGGERLSRLPGASPRPAGAGDLTLKRLADFLDHDAEDQNAHDFVGLHRALAALLCRQASPPVAREVFLWLLDHGGLHGVAGVTGVAEAEAAFADLGVPEPWFPWRLPG